MLVDAAKVNRSGGGEGRAARRSHRDERAATVVFTGHAFDQARPGHPIDKAREACPAEEDELGEVVHAHAPVSGFAQLHEDVVPAQGQVTLRNELALENLGDARMDRQEGAPCRNLLPGGLGSVSHGLAPSVPYVPVWLRRLAQGPP